MQEQALSSPSPPTIAAPSSETDAAKPGRMAALREWLAGAWAPSLVFSIHMVIDKGFHVYKDHPNADIPMHLVGGFAIAYFFLCCWRAAIARGHAGRPTAAVTLAMIFALTCSAAVFWEFGEYLSDWMLSTHVQVDMDDTLSDMLFGILGGIPMAILGWRAARRTETETAEGGTAGSLPSNRRGRSSAEW
jgi:hypothetical protein